MIQEMTNSTSIVWQSLLPSIKGEATVTVRLEDDSGNLLSGRVLNVQVGSDLITRLEGRRAMFMAGALIAILFPTSIRWVGPRTSDEFHSITAPYSQNCE